MSPKPKILAISGSTKNESSNKKLIQYIARLHRNIAEIEIFCDIDQIPHFNPDLDNDMPPVSITALRNKISKADGILFCTPEYVFSLPGSLKNLIEWMVSTTLFSNKPIAIIVGAASGKKAMESLKLIMTTIEGVVNENTNLIIKGAKGKFKKNGVLDDQQTVENLQTLMTNFLKVIETGKLKTAR